MLLFLLACGAHVHDAYREHRAFALEEPGPAKGWWAPDATLRVSEPTLVAGLGVAVARAAAEVQPLDVGLGTARPKVRLRGARVLDSAPCPGCVSMQILLEGEVEVRAGPFVTQLPYTTDAQVGLRVDTAPTEQGLQLTLRVTELEQVQIETTGVPMFDMTPLLEDWGGDLVAAIPAVDLGTFGSEELPVRDLRLAPDRGGLRVDILTLTAHGAPIASLGDPPPKGFQIVVSESTLLDIARRKAFEAGELKMGIQPEPLSIDVDGSRFTLGLRLWRLKGRGWWRDYEVKGTIQLADGEVQLVAEEVAETAHSPGAGLVDPLAAIADQRILDQIAHAATRAAPAQHPVSKDGLAMTLSVSGAEGRGESLVLSGDARIE